MMEGPISREEQLLSSRIGEDSEQRDSKDPTREAITAQEKPSFTKRIWENLGLNVGVLSMMFKGTLPPTIAIGLYQSTAFAETYSTLGYLVAVMSILSFAIMPRAKFFQTMLFNVIGIGIGACIALLTIYCSVQARAHTTAHQADTSPSASGGPSPGAAVVPYNSSASVVCAISLFFNIYVSNTLRALKPQLQFPVIMYSIFANVTSIYAPQFATMTQGIAFTKRLIEAFLTGFAIASGVSLLVFPLTSRTVVFKTAAGYIGALRGALKAQRRYLESLENENVFSSQQTAEDGLSDGHHEHHHNLFHHQKQAAASQPSAEAQALKTMIATLAELQGKIGGDVAFAKREVAYGNLDASDLSQMIKLMQQIMLPIFGMSTVADIFDRAAEERGWKPASEGGSSYPERSRDVKEREIRQWNEVMKTLHHPFNVLTEAMDQGLQHTLYTLDLAKRPKKGRGLKTGDEIEGASSDTEAKGGIIEPGDKNFADSLSASIDHFYEQRELTLNAWCIQHNADLNEARNQASMQLDSEVGTATTDHQRRQRQLYLTLYIEFLLRSTGRAILDLVRFADEKAGQGVIKKKRIIAPGMKRVSKWLSSALATEDSSVDHTPDSTETRSVSIEIGNAYQKSRDPEHLPPTNTWQRLGNFVRGISRILGTQESAFGFRVACATLTIGIVAYLKDTQAFFMQQRLVWAMIMVAIGMTVTAGAGVFGFIGRIAGTGEAQPFLPQSFSIAMCTSYLIWYIVDGKTSGVIVLLAVFTFFEWYFILKFPRFIVIALISMVTQVLIVGYELQVRKVGLQVAESSGQPAYPLYELAPYRLACVAGGLGVAFIWTFFPYPLTARSQLRKDLGASLYLLANYYSCVHTTVEMRLSGLEGDPEDRKSPGRRLEKARVKVFTKELGLLAGLRQHLSFTAWEPSFGGKFPRQQYDTIIHEVQNILNYIALISYASNILSNKDEDDPDQASWLKTFARLVRSVNVTSQELTTVLSLLSASVTNGSPLPPYLKAPEPFKLSTKLEAIDADILDISHVTEPGYAAFAVIQIASSLISDDIGKLISNVRLLVGEVDFSFHLVSSSDDILNMRDGSKGKKE